MPTPTDDRRDLLTVIAFMKAAQLDAHLAAPHLVRFASMIDENRLTITRLRRIA